jgi:hypothetical protein
MARKPAAGTAARFKVQIIYIILGEPNIEIVLHNFRLREDLI